MYSDCKEREGKQQSQTVVQALREKIEGEEKATDVRKAATTNTNINTNTNILRMNSIRIAMFSKTQGYGDKGEFNSVALTNTT